MAALYGRRLEAAGDKALVLETLTAVAVAR
jgi:hypothetical protein